MGSRRTVYVPPRVAARVAGFAVGSNIAAATTLAGWAAAGYAIVALLLLHKFDVSLLIDIVMLGVIGGMLLSMKQLKFMFHARRSGGIVVELPEWRVVEEKTGRKGDRILAIATADGKKAACFIARDAKEDEVEKYIAACLALQGKAPYT